MARCFSIAAGSIAAESTSVIAIVCVIIGRVFSINTKSVLTPAVIFKINPVAVYSPCSKNFSLIETELTKEFFSSTIACDNSTKSSFTSRITIVTKSEDFESTLPLKITLSP